MSWKAYLDSNLQRRREQGLWRERISLSGPQGSRVLVDGKTLINFCSNDYLGLANDPQVLAAGQQALADWGSGSGASHLICGHSQLHDRLELRLADMFQAEKAIVFSTGYMANLAIPQTLLDRHDLLLEDKLNHASLLDGGALGRAEMRRYPHLDLLRLEEMLAQSTAPKKMVMTDGVFSMDGDVAPLPAMWTICQRSQAMLVVDDAHGFGVLGASGKGIMEVSGLRPADNLLLVGTLGKACGTFGAFVVGDRSVIETLIQQARPYIYTTALPPVVMAMTLAALDQIEQQPDRRQRLRENVQTFRELAKEGGIRLGSSTTPIQPVFPPIDTPGWRAQSPDLLPRQQESATPSTPDLSIQWALATSRRLADAGIWVSAIRPPTVPAGTARLRVTLTASHTESEIRQLVQAISEASR